MQPSKPLSVQPFALKTVFLETQHLTEGIASLHRITQIEGFILRNVFNLNLELRVIKDPLYLCSMLLCLYPFLIRQDLRVILFSLFNEGGKRNSFLGKGSSGRVGYANQ